MRERKRGWRVRDMSVQPQEEKDVGRMETGTIVRVVGDKGYLFIQPTDAGAKDIFCHISGFRVRLTSLDDGLISRRVEYALKTVGGRTRAEDVCFLD